MKDDNFETTICDEDSSDDDWNWALQRKKIPESQKSKLKPTFEPEPNPSRMEECENAALVRKTFLEKEFLFSRYPSEERNLKIAKHLGLSENQIKNWFENRRKKARQDSKQLQQRHHS